MTRDLEPIADLNPGDVLSYSAGSTQTGPKGYRKVLGRGNLLSESAKRWPEMLEVLGDRPILFINAYPATLGAFSSGISVDTYLSPRVFTRAVQLGKAGNHPTIIVGQPLFLADAFQRHVSNGFALPEILMLWTGGYVMQQSLEKMLVAILEPHVRKLLIVQYFGVAEVDAACMMARERNEEGHPIYYPREDVVASIEDGKLFLAVKGEDGTPLAEPFLTGDAARHCDSSMIIWNDKRLHPDVHEELESWSVEDWKRRTGYVRRDSNKIIIQCREGVTVDKPHELEHYEFGRHYGFSWLNKPYWR